MYKNKMSYKEYVNEVERIFCVERREAYYYPFFIDFIRPLLSSEEILVPVWDNKGYSDDTKNSRHKRMNYADSGSLQDFIITSPEYSYENTKKPFVSIELKRPILSKGVTLSLDSQNIRKELEAEFRFCDYIICTDLITWYFLEKHENSAPISLMKGQQWLQFEHDIDSSKIINRLGNINLKEPNDWIVLLERIGSFIRKSKSSI